MDQFSKEELDYLRKHVAEDINYRRQWLPCSLDEQDEQRTQVRIDWLETLLTKIDLERLHRRQSEQ